MLTKRSLGSSHSRTPHLRIGFAFRTWRGNHRPGDLFPADFTPPAHRLQRF